MAFQNQLVRTISRFAELTRHQARRAARAGEWWQSPGCRATESLCESAPGPGALGGGRPGDPPVCREAGPESAGTRLRGRPVERELCL